jgi:hypothetical protein
MSRYARWIAGLVSFATLVALAAILPGSMEPVKLGTAGMGAVDIPEIWIRLALCILTALVSLGLSGPAIDRTLAVDTMLGGAAIALTVWAVAAGLVVPLSGILLAIFAATGAIAIQRAVRGMQRDPIRIEAHWGGLGGGLGGWRLSEPLVLLLVGVVCVGAAGLIVAQSAPQPPRQTSQVAAQPEK